MAQIAELYVLVVGLGLLELNGQKKLVIDLGEAARDGHNALVINPRPSQTPIQRPIKIGHQSREALAQGPTHAGH